MPHIIVKLWPGKSEQQKKKLSAEITDAVTRVLECAEESVSVGFEEIEAEDWREKVYIPDITEKQKTIYKKPGYSM